MNKPQKQHYVYGMLAGFGAISLSVVFFFILFRAQNIRGILDNITKILMPFVYGGVIAYLLCPTCNAYSDFFRRTLPEKGKRFSEPIAIVLSLLTGMLIVYLLIIMVVPQLVNSIVNMWEGLPGEVESLFNWFRDTYGDSMEAEKILTYLTSGYDTIYSTIDSWAESTLVPYITNIVGGVGMGVCIVRVKGGSAPASGGSTGTGTGSSTGSSTGTTTTEPSAANAKINKTDITLAVGELFPLKITGYSGTVTWSVGDSSIASVNTDGTVKGVKSGRTTVTAKVGDRTLSCIIRVKNG